MKIGKPIQDNDPAVIHENLANDGEGPVIIYEENPPTDNLLLDKNTDTLIKDDEPNIIIEDDQPDIIIEDNTTENDNPDIIPNNELDNDLEPKPDNNTDVVIIKHASPIFSVDESIKGYNASVKATWANAYTQPELNRGLCIISFDRNVLKSKYNTDSLKVGTLTGNIAVDYKNRKWYEVNLLHADRMNIGWMKESAINITVPVMVDKNTTPTNTDKNTVSNDTIKKGLISLGIFSAIVLLLRK